MKYLSVCSGIEAATVAWRPLGWKAVAFSEIDAFPNSVLAHHYPDVPNWGDMTSFKRWPDADVDLLVGGTPCQSFSIAGLRKGLADPRGNLMLTYLAIARRYRPRWIFWENVSGVLSSNGGGDFATFLGVLGKLGYGWAYRVLDAQYYGVAQRRRRVFVVGCLGSWAGAAAVLFESSSLQGHPPPRREARKDIAGTVKANPGIRGEPSDGIVATLDANYGRLHGASGQDLNHGHNHRLVAFGGNNTRDELEVATAVRAHGSAHQDFESETFLVAHTLRGGGFDASEDGSGRGIPLVPISFDCVAAGNTGFSIGSTAGALRAGDHTSGHSAVADTSGVRRLTPLECERLQGFPDNYTLVPIGRGMAKDGPRYRSIGNSKAVPVVNWLGRRIEKVSQLIKEMGNGRDFQRAANKNAPLRGGAGRRGRKGNRH